MPEIDGPDWISDAELTDLALAADADAPVPDDAVPFDARDKLAAELLPSWYMPAPSLRRSRPRTVVFAVVVIALIALNVSRFCRKHS